MSISSQVEYDITQTLVLSIPKLWEESPLTYIPACERGLLARVVVLHGRGGQPPGLLHHVHHLAHQPIPLGTAGNYVS